MTTCLPPWCSDDDLMGALLRSLLCRTFDTALAECCCLEGVGLMAYSPLAMGLLTVSL